LLIWLLSSLTEPNFSNFMKRSMSWSSNFTF
jgi:hypothetical protein